MTKTLSRLLGAKEPSFSLSLRQLEQASGQPSADIQLSTEVTRAARSKLRQLGLDPKDTTGEELYRALLERVQEDDARLAATLKVKFSMKNGLENDDIGNVARALSQVPIPKSCFALKNSKAKNILKEIPPKKVMKALGYRSLESMLKHETAASLLAAGRLVETPGWQRSLSVSYNKLSAADFEVREMSIVHPSSRRWQSLAESVVARAKNNVVAIKELGAVVILPLPAARPPVATIATATLALHALNEVRAASTYLKLCQVKPDFGASVLATVTGEPRLSTELLEGPLPWHVIQRYYSRFACELKSEIFEPHVQPEDLSWHSVEKVLAYLEPSLEFWRHTSRLGFMHGDQPVSLNIIDAVINRSNQLSYDKRLAYYLRHNLWHELLLRYIQPKTVEQTVLAQLEPEFAAETIPA